MKYLKSMTAKATICYLLLSTVVSCGNNNETKEWSPVTYADVEDYNIIEIDGCEYISRWRQMAHKGNCKNPIHDCR